MYSNHLKRKWKEVKPYKRICIRIAAVMLLCGSVGVTIFAADAQTVEVKKDLNSKEESNVVSTLETTTVFSTSTTAEVESTTELLYSTVETTQTVTTQTAPVLEASESTFTVTRNFSPYISSRNYGIKNNVEKQPNATKIEGSQTDVTTVEETQTEETKTETEKTHIEETQTSESQTEVLQTEVTESFEVNLPENHITKNSGVGTAPNGFKETYYDMKMDGVVKKMRNLGYSEEEYPYWVHPVMGTKMLGDYIMVAADIDQKYCYNWGDLVETDLGTGIVCDTGSFRFSNPAKYDIAVDWGYGYYPGFND